jgi:hypothetical protein
VCPDDQIQTCFLRNFGTAPFSALAAGECVTQALFGPEFDFTSMVRPFEQWAGVEVRSPRTV